MCKKILCMLLTVILLTGLFGCGAKENGTEANHVFTDDFFSDVVEIRDSSCGQVSGEQLEPVILYLKGLALKETDQHLSTTNEQGEQLYGLGAITFVMSDGTEITVLHNHATLTFPDLLSYVTEEENLNTGLENAFQQALQGSDG